MKVFQKAPITKFKKNEDDNISNICSDQCGKAEEAINFYTSIFPNSEIKSIIKYAEGKAGGTPELIKHGIFTLNNTEYMVSESDYNHAWAFTPGVSLFVS